MNKVETFLEILGDYAPYNEPNMDTEYRLQDILQELQDEGASETVELLWGEAIDEGCVYIEATRAKMKTETVCDVLNDIQESVNKLKELICTQ